MPGGPVPRSVARTIDRPVGRAFVRTVAAAGSPRIAVGAAPVTAGTTIAAVALVGAFPARFVATLPGSISRAIAGAIIRAVTPSIAWTVGLAIVAIRSRVVGRTPSGGVVAAVVPDGAQRIPTGWLARVPAVVGSLARAVVRSDLSFGARIAVLRPPIAVPLVALRPPFVARALAFRPLPVAAVGIFARLIPVARIAAGRIGVRRRPNGLLCLGARSSGCFRRTGGRPFGRRRRRLRRAARWGRGLLVEDVGPEVTHATSVQCSNREDQRRGRAAHPREGVSPTTAAP
jgi:hypothetical protein